MSRNERSELKNKISSLATSIKIGLNQNQTLIELIDINQRQININKENLKKLYSFNLPNNNKKEFKNEIIKELGSNNKELLSLNNYLNTQINNIKAKYNSLNEKIFKNNEDENNKLELLKERQFIYENALEEKESKIKLLNNCINKYKAKFEPENEIEILSDEQGYDSEDEISKNLNLTSNILANKCLSFNKYKKINKIMKGQISKLKSKIKKMNAYIKNLQDINKNFDYIDLPNNSNIYIEGEDCMKEDNNKNSETNMNTDESSLCSDHSYFSESDEDMEISQQIISPILKDKEKQNLYSFIPKIDLSLINYNKKKERIEEKEKSLSRDNNFDQDELSMRINKIKKSIELNIDKKVLLIEKLKKYKNKIIKLNDKFREIYTPPAESFILKGIKKRKFLFNSSFNLTNNSLAKTNRKLLSDKNEFLNNLNSFNSNRLI